MESPHSAHCRTQDSASPGRSSRSSSVNSSSSSKSLNSSFHSNRSSPSKSPCTQCIILHQRMKTQLKQQFGGSFKARSHHRETPSPIHQFTGPDHSPCRSSSSTQTKSSQTFDDFQPAKVVVRNLNYEFISANLVNQRRQPPQPEQPPNPANSANLPTSVSNISNNDNFNQSAVDSQNFCHNSISIKSRTIQLLLTQLWVSNYFRFKMFRLCLVSLLYLTTLVAISALVFYRIQPKPFIDEIFHIPQALAYLNGNFSYWDQKITTPPGLYLSSTGLIGPIVWLFGPWILDHSTLFLRLTNCLFATGNWLLIYYLISDQKAQSLSRSLPSSLSLSLFPPLFFFSFLYYTEAGSVFFLLLTGYFGLCRDRHWTASVFGLISLLFRQTNIVWLFLVAFTALLNLVQRELNDIYEYRLMNFFVLGSSRFVVSFGPSQCKLSNLRYLSMVLFDLVCKIVHQFGGYLLDGLCFVGFLYWNNGIVLGDRTSHEAVLHLAQLPYLLLFFTIFGFPHLFTRSNLSHFLSMVRFRPLLILCLASLLVLALSSPFRYVHPYLLADNRHYSFYLWRRLLDNPNFPVLCRFGPIPVYLFTLISVWNSLQFRDWNSSSSSRSLRRTKHWLTDSRLDQLLRSAFACCTLLTIVPQKLLELRYFIVPFLFWRLISTNRNVQTQARTQPTGLISTLLELVFFVLINLATIWIFVTKTFLHPADPDPSQLQRIIW